MFPLQTFEELKVEPDIGKAVLFYSQLPDGNMDDFSLHAALPVRRGEKWMVSNVKKYTQMKQSALILHMIYISFWFLQTNLWVWDVSCCTFLFHVLNLCYLASC
jgi:hypothetical protein